MLVYCGYSVLRIISARGVLLGQLMYVVYLYMPPVYPELTTTGVRACPVPLYVLLPVYC